MEIDKKLVGERISAIRKSLGLTMEMFGNKVLNADRSLVSKWERGKAVPNNARVKIIAELGNVSVSYLLYGKTTFDDLSDEDKSRILAEQSENLSKREKGGIESLQYFLDNYRESLSYRRTVNLLSAALRYSYINEKQPDEDPKLIRSLEYIIKILNDYTTSGEMTSNKTKEQVRENLIEHLSDILDNSKNEIE